MISGKSTAWAAVLACAGICVTLTGCAIYQPPSGGPAVPARTAAEYLTASKFRAVAIVAGVGPHRPSRTLTSPSVIGQLASLLDSLSVDTRTGAYNCPAAVRSYTLTFRPRSAAGPRVIVSWSDCLSDTVAVDGVTQPALADPTSELARCAAQLTRTGPVGDDPAIFSS
jgi:hypothetical protein